jgi:hypothetical protein
MKRNAIPIREFVDSLLLSLCREYESNPFNGVVVDRTALVGQETVESYLAGLCAVGWLRACYGSVYLLTPNGYIHFGPRVRELRDCRQQELRDELLKKVSPAKERDPRRTSRALGRTAEARSKGGK